MIFKTLDDLGVTQRSEGRWPAAVLDGHFTRLSAEFLEYVNNDDTKWEAGLGASYATDHWQLHDDERQNGSLSMAIGEAKTNLIRKKILHELPPNIERHEIVLIVNEATEKSFANKEHTKRALALRGWNPPNRACLDHAEILETAPEEVKKERARILKNRQHVPQAKSRAVLPPPSETDLLTVGSGRLLGGASASSMIASTAQNLNLTTGRPADIMEMAHNASKTNAGRARAVEATTGRKSREQLEKALSEAKKITAGVVIAKADGKLCREVFHEVHARNEYQKDNEAAQLRKKKKRIWDLKKDVDNIRLKMRITKKFKLKQLKVAELKKLCRWKKKKGDDALPTKKDDLMKRWKKDMNNTSPHASPCNSLDELDADVQSLADSETSAFDNDAFLLGEEEEANEDTDSDEEGSDNDDEEDDE